MGSHSIDYLAELEPELDLTLNFASDQSPLGDDLNVFTQMDFYDVFTKDSLPSYSFANGPVLKQESTDGVYQSHANTTASPSTSSLAASPASSDALDTCKSSNNSLDDAFHDKRKRNTAALARFRIKKKMKEQALHDRARELTDRLQALEAKLRAVEMENKCLRSMILQKNESESVDLVQQIKGRSIADSAPAPFSFTT